MHWERDSICREFTFHRFGLSGQGMLQFKPPSGSRGGLSGSLRARRLVFLANQPKGAPAADRSESSTLDRAVAGEGDGSRCEAFASQETNADPNLRRS